MAEQAEKEKQESRAEKILARQNRLKNEIAPRIAEIQTLLDSLTAFVGKESFQDADFEGAFDVMDGIREKADAIEELLFSLRDTVR
jgi:hypothetical protein